MGGEGQSTEQGQPAGMTLVESTLLKKFGDRYALEPARVYSTLCRTAFREAKTAEQVFSLLIVADQYGLNPFTKEIFAFPDKFGGVVPVVGIDGWTRIAQAHPQFNGYEVRYAEARTTPPQGKDCPEWAEVVIYRKDQDHPTVVREYLDEVYRGQINGKDGPWQTHTKRMLRHKVLIQGFRSAFGFHGIYDPDEAESFVDITPTAVMPTAGRHGKEGGMTLEVKTAGDPPETLGADATPAAEDDGTGL
jgi:phage recombination protein Bet